MKYDISKIPFSYRGSYLAITLSMNKDTKHKNKRNGFFLKTIHGGVTNNELFLIELIKEGKNISFTYEMEPYKLRFNSQESKVDICFINPRSLRFKGEGVGIRFSSEYNTPFNTAIKIDEKRYCINIYESKTQLMINILKGICNIDAPWDGVSCNYINIEIMPDETGFFDITIDEFSGSWVDYYSEDFDNCVLRAKTEFYRFLNLLPDVAPLYYGLKETAAYIIWSSFVEPYGFIKRPAILMSKNWMTHIWSWDHCFNALALSFKSPEIAWNQFMVIFDHQNIYGALPDSINDSSVIWNYCKPPIHGWTLRKMMKDAKAIDIVKLKEIYEPLCLWTEWWFKYRDDDKDGIPQYNHGNESGWDNSTVFISRPPIESPDLTAFLIIQIEVLAELAKILNKKKEYHIWNEKLYKLIDNFSKHFISDNRLLVKHSLTHEIISTNSLLPYISLIIADKLPKSVSLNLISDLTKFRTIYGLATESIDSQYYKDDGYWRGPIWAPPTLLLVDALKNMNEIAFAKEIIESFISLIFKSGFSENFDALKGNGYRDPAYTWTASVFLLLARERELLQDHSL